MSFISFSHPQACAYSYSHSPTHPSTHTHTLKRNKAQCLLEIHSSLTVSRGDLRTVGQGPDNKYKHGQQLSSCVHASKTSLSCTKIRQHSWILVFKCFWCSQSRKRSTFSCSATSLHHVTCCVWTGRGVEDAGPLHAHHDPRFENIRLQNILAPVSSFAKRSANS